MTKSLSLPRETVELVPVVVTNRETGAAVITDVETAITLGAARPTTWTDAVVVADKTYALISGLRIGTWTVWARVTAAPEAPVIDCGRITIT